MESVAATATWITGSIDARRPSTGAASFTSVPVSDMAHSTWLIPILDASAASRVTSNVRPGVCSARRFRSTPSSSEPFTQTARDWLTSATFSSSRKARMKPRASALVGKWCTSAPTTSARVLKASKSGDIGFLTLTRRYLRCERCSLRHHWNHPRKYIGHQEDHYAHQAGEHDTVQEDI